MKGFLTPLNQKEKGSCPSSSAACAAASTKVSLNESEREEEALSAIAEAYTVPQWDDNARVTELANTLTALTLAGVPVQDTSMKDVVISLRRIVTVTNSPAEAAVDFSMVPRNPVRPRVYEVHTEPNASPTFNVLMQELKALSLNVELVENGQSGASSAPVQQ